VTHKAWFSPRDWYSCFSRCLLVSRIHLPPFRFLSCILCHSFLFSIAYSSLTVCYVAYNTVVLLRSLLILDSKFIYSFIYSNKRQNAFVVTKRVGRIPVSKQEVIAMFIDASSFRCHDTLANDDVAQPALEVLALPVVWKVTPGTSCTFTDNKRTHQRHTYSWDSLSITQWTTAWKHVRYHTIQDNVEWKADGVVNSIPAVSFLYCGDHISTVRDSMKTKVRHQLRNYSLHVR